MELEPGPDLAKARELAQERAPGSAWELVLEAVRGPVQAQEPGSVRERDLTQASTRWASSAATRIRPQPTQRTICPR